MSTVIVAGGAGYIGSHTIRELQNGGFEPVVLDNLVYGHRKIVEDVLGVPLVIGKVGDKKLLEKLLAGNHPSTKGKDIKGIMHFAAYAYVGESVIDPAKYYKNNLAETIMLLEALLEDAKKKNSQPVPIVFSSTCATYGLPSETEIPIRETTLQNPINPYGWSKLMIEKILIDYHKAYKLPVSILRYFNAAGADIKGDIGEDHNPETHLIPLVLEGLFSKEGFIKINGIDYPTFDGTCIRDYVHVSDLAKAHVLALNKIINDRSL
jgi:UDP-glucose 4-epimerase